MTQPGWYKDRRDPTLARWHDGTGWTRHTVLRVDWEGRGTPPPPPGRGGPRGSGSGRPPWLTGRLAILAVAVVILLVLVQRVFFAGSSDDRLTYHAQWHTIDGSSYRMTVIADPTARRTASPGG